MSDDGGKRRHPDGSPLKPPPKHSGGGARGGPGGGRSLAAGLDAAAEERHDAEVGPSGSICNWKCVACSKDDFRTHHNFMKHQVKSRAAAS